MGQGPGWDGYDGIPSGLRLSYRRLAEKPSASRLSRYSRTVEIKRQSAGEILTDDPVHEQLADFPLLFEDALRPQQDLPFFVGHAADERLELVARPRLVHPEIEQVQGMDDEDFPDFSPRGRPQFFRGFENFQNILLGEAQFELGVGPEQLVELLRIVALPQAQVRLRSAVPSMTPATTSEAALEMMAAHFCRMALTPGTPAVSRDPDDRALRPMASGMERMLRKKFPPIAALGRPRKALWLEM